MRTLFISDLHLSDKRPDLLRALLHFLEENKNSCDQLYLLGDIFDAWIGDDFVHPAIQPLSAALNALADNGTEIFFQHGNRDFLVGQTFADSIQAQLLPEEIVVTLPDGKSALIMHGDQLCTDDTEYQQLRVMLRNPQWQQQVLQKSVEERLAMASQLKAESSEQKSQKSVGIMDVNAESVRQAMNKAECDLLIHGHTHRPAIHNNQRSDTCGTRIVLGDWDTELWYLECSETGQELKHRPL